MDVDVVCDLMIHDLDILYYLFKGDSKSVQAVGHKVRTSKWDHVLVRMEFESGTCAFLTAGRNYIEEVRNFETINTRGCFFVNLYRHEAKILDNKSKDNKVSTLSYEKKDHLLCEQEHFYKSILFGEHQKETADCREGVLIVRIIDKILQAWKQEKKFLLKTIRRFL